MTRDHASPGPAPDQPHPLGPSAPTGSVLVARGIEKTYPRRGLRRPLPVLTDANMSLGPGEVVGLVGENGSGKSTLMRILVGDLRADAGSVTRQGQIVYCPQTPVVYPRLTCDEHFGIFARAYGLTSGQEHESRSAIYESLGFQRYARTRADQLSGGHAGQAQSRPGTPA